MESQIFDIAGDVVAATDHRLQGLLEQVYGTDVRPRCLCVDGGIEMYVARHWRFVVKRLPGTGKSHHPTCPAYELDPGPLRPRRLGLRDRRACRAVRIEGGLSVDPVDA